MVYRVHRGTHRMPVLVAFALIALVIWIAENSAASAGAWLYPRSMAGSPCRSPRWSPGFC
ncbi:DUF817 family protein [Rathayibacter rathayi]|uniref:DUF817 family protein n=1 Tax=Rathayibacter rathayi TaxID=33887 RepID=UPI0030B89B4F